MQLVVPVNTGLVNYMSCGNEDTYRHTHTLGFVQSHGTLREGGFCAQCSNGSTYSQTDKNGRRICHGVFPAFKNDCLNIIKCYICMTKWK